VAATIADGDPVERISVKQDREFVAAVREGRDPAIDAAAVRPAMAVLQAMQDRPL
jgi:hypothetical protein